ncbi:uncharacterized protein [Coffea arabica]|uniref:DDE Tnp4 domain-containing protein n=1 Tax=Coffea arabica TaxID=13443 RepID=A0ABM4WQ84_COFAR
METIDQHVHRVLRALVRLDRDLVRPRNFNDTHPRIINNQLFWPWFKNCVGVLDGTHVSAWVRAEIQERYRNRYSGLSQNVLAVCDHDMRFVYVRVGYEGSTHDARILRNTLLDLNLGFPMAPEGKYYAGDTAYTNMPRFMAPFRGARGTQHERANYLIATQNNIVLACCTLHNFIRDNMPNDMYFNEEAALGALADAQDAGNEVQGGQNFDFSQ